MKLSFIPILLISWNNEIVITTKLYTHWLFGWSNDFFTKIIQPTSFYISFAVKYLDQQFAKHEYFNQHRVVVSKNWRLMKQDWTAKFSYSVIEKSPPQNFIWRTLHPTNGDGFYLAKPQTIFFGQNDEKSAHLGILTFSWPGNCPAQRG